MAFNSHHPGQRRKASELIGRLVNGDNFRFELFRERNRIVDMIEMPVRDKHRVNSIELMALRVHGIAFHPRVRHNHFAGVQTELERSVAKPRDLKHVFQSNAGSASRCGG
jgi:hypothetical protein